MYAPGGRYEHIPLRLARVDQGDVDILVAAADRLNERTPDWCVRESLDEMACAYSTTAEGLAGKAARLADLLNMHALDRDCRALIWVLSSAGRSERIVLTEAEEQAYRRLTRETNRRWTGGSALAAWAY
jgi:hypothetical protein